eukprot:gene14005-18899_t
MVLPSATFAYLQGEAIARWIVLFDARVFFMTPHFRRNAIGAAVLSLAALAGAAQAQTAPTPSTADNASLREVTVTGNPLGASDLIAPTTTLSGDKLLLRSESTLGETLNNLPG